MSNLPTEWTHEQRAVVESLRGAGATNADSAVRIERRLAPSESTLKPLIDAGIVREASRDRYYVHEASVSLSRVAMLGGYNELASHIADARRPLNRSRVIRAIIFWLVFILIPIVMIQLLGRNG